MLVLPVSPCSFHVFLVFFFVILHVLMRRSNCIPLRWAHSLAITAAKSNGVVGIPGLRILHMLDAYGKNFAAGQLTRKKESEKRQGEPCYVFPDYSHGFLTCRRREAAMAVQMIVTQKLLKHKIAHITDFKDIKNAFPSMSQAAYVKALWWIAPHDAQDLCAHFFENASFELHCPDGKLEGVMIDGGMMGHPLVVAAFNCAFQEPVREWQLAQRCWDGEADLLLCKADCIDSSYTVDMSVTTFADDCAKKLIGKNINELVSKHRRSSDDFSRQLVKSTLVASEQKEEIVPSFAGQHSVNNLRACLSLVDFGSSAVRSEARYLGGRFHTRTKNHPEIKF